MSYLILSLIKNHAIKYCAKVFEKDGKKLLVKTLVSVLIK